MRENANTVEAEKGQILHLVGKHGEETLESLVRAYQTEPIVKKAILEMTTESVGSYMRQILLRVIAEGGAREDAEYLGLLLSSGHLPKFSYPFKEKFEFEGDFLYADKDEKVRMTTATTIENIFSRKAGSGEGFICSSLGRTLINSTMFDPSESVRQLAAIAIAKHGDRATLTNLCLKIRDAERVKKEGLFRRGAEAVKTICWVLGKVRVRGTALYGLTALAISGGRAGKVGQEAIVCLGKSNSDVISWLEKEQLKIHRSHDRETSPEEKERRNAVLDEIINEIGPLPSKKGRKQRKKITYGEEIKPEELMQPPKQMKGKRKPQLKPTNPMRPVSSSRKPKRRRADLEDEPVISRGPVVDKILGAGRAIKRIVRGPGK